MTATMLLLGIIYLLNRSPYIGFNDGMSFLLSASKGWDLDTNATSHFLYNNLLHVLLKVFFFLPQVFVLTTFSIICSLLAIWIFGKVLGLFSQDRFLNAMAMLTLGLSFTFWQQTEVVEVYAFNNVIFLSCLYLGLRDIFGEHRKGWFWLSILMGLGLLTHIQHILSLPFFLFYLFGKNELFLARKLGGLLLTLALASPLFLLPILLQTHSLMAVFIESKFQSDLFGMDLGAMLKGIGLGLGMLCYNFLFALPFVLKGWLRLWKTDRQRVWLLLLVLLPYFGFAFKYSVNDNHVFFLAGYFVLLLPLGLGLKGIRLGNWALAALVVIMPMAMYASASILAKQVPRLREYDSAKAYKGGVLHLLWPGKAWAEDPLALAAELYGKEDAASVALKAEWNYPAAEEYLRLQGKLDTLPFIYFEF